MITRPQPFRKAKCFCFATASVCLALARPAYAITYLTITDPSNPTFTQTLGINGSGTIVGYGNATASNGFQLTLPSTFTRENFPGSAGTQVIGIDSAGNTVGFYVDVSGNNHGFYRTGGGTFSTVDNPLGSFNQVLGINQAGNTAAGYTSANSTGATGQQAFTVSVPGPGFVFTNINSLLPANTNSQATGVNNSGMVVGFYQTASGNFTAFSDVGGTIKSFQATGAVSTQALGVNDLGQIVGDYVTSSGSMFAFIDIAGIFQTLNPPGAISSTANGINDLGQIVGFYTAANGSTFGFETQVSAVPLPAALPLFASGLVGLGLLGWRRKRKAKALSA
jgi:ribosomal protein L31